VGGGGGGGGNWGGGGGAGQVVTGSTNLSKNDTYDVIIANGGTGSTGTGQGTNGGTTTFSGTSFSVTAIGGGGGGYNTTPSTATNGSNGASGGGGGGGGTSRSTGGTGTNGFNGGGVTADSNGAGGGGGSSQSGTNGSFPDAGGKGGNGTTFNITGSAVVYAGGGGGGGANGSTLATGGTGGGGNGGNTTSGAGANATGYGSGGGGGATNSGNGGNGSNGVVILSIPTNQLGTYSGSPTVTTNDIYTILTFTGNGSFTSTSTPPTPTPTPTVTPTPTSAFSAGIFKTTYSGYHNEDPTFFATATPTSFGSNPATSVQTTSITEPSSNDGSNFSCQWLGYFKATTTETYTFFLSSDDGSYLWIGANALSGFTTANANINNGGAHGVQEVSATFSLTAGVFYPIRIQFGEIGGGDEMTFSYSSPTITKTTNVTGLVFYNPSTNGF
jgi:hypothetical protein